VILADTKFEFGLKPEGPFTAPIASDMRTSSQPTDETPASTSHCLLLIDELLTPDSSRYWPKDGYTPGVPQPSFDKQYLRDWLKSAGFRKGLENGPTGKEGEGWFIDETVVQGTQKRYEDAVEKIMGE
jgi:phosphoribosylaminoimidazole-succinocarboxamide synthase